MSEAMPEAADVASQVAEAYRIDVTAVAPMPGGLVHPAWRLTAPGGGWLAKWYRGTAWGCAQLAPVFEAQTAAADAGLPAPRLLADHAGQPFSPWRGGLLVCMQYLPGSTPAQGSLNAAMAEATGTALGRLHRTLAVLPAGEPRVPDAAQLSVYLRDLLALAEGWPNPTAGDRLAVESLRYRLAALKEPGIDVTAYGDCAWQVCHGDFFPANLLFEGDELTGVVDFDFAGPRWRAMELARAAVEVAWQAGGGIAPALYRAVLAGYQGTNPLSAAELRAGPRLWWEYLLHSVYPIAARYSDPAGLPERWVELLRRRHGYMLWLGEHLDTPRGVCQPPVGGGSRQRKDLWNERSL